MKYRARNSFFGSLIGILWSGALGLALAGCGALFSGSNAPNLPPPQILSGLPGLSQLPDNRDTAVAYNEEMLGSESFSRSNNAAVDGTRLVLDAGSGSMSWGIWRWHAPGRDLNSVQFNMLSEAGQEFFLAIGDYQDQSWKIYGPLTQQSTTGFALDSDVHLSPNGNFYCAAVTWDGNLASVQSIRLQVETGSTYNEVEDNGSFSEANQLPHLPVQGWQGHIGSQTTGWDHYDYYSFRAAEGQVVTITLTYDNAAATVYLALYDSDKTILVNDTSGNPGIRIIKQGLSAGTMWIRVTAYAGECAYTLDVDVETPGYDEVEDNDGYAAAQQVLLPVTNFKGSVGQFGYDGDDVDYFAFDAGDGDVVTITLDYEASQANIFLGLFNEAHGTVIIDDGPSTDHRAISWGLKQGTHFVRVSADSGSADYSMSISIVNPGYDESEDNDSFTDADALSLPMTGWSGSVGDTGYDGDNFDYLQFTAQDGDQLTVDLAYDSATANIYLRLYDTDHTTLSYDEGANTGHRSLTWGLKSGIHFLQIRAFSGYSDYSLDASVSRPGYDETEDNDSFAEADQLTPPMVGLLGSVGASGYDGDADDFFALSVTDGQVASVTLSYDMLAGNVALRLYDSDKTLIAVDSVGNPGARSLTWGLKAGAHFVKVTGVTGTCDYALGVSVSTPGFNEVEDNDSLAEATPLPSLSFTGYYGSIGPGSYDGDDYDYFTFTISSAVTVTFDLGYDNSSLDNNVWLYILNGTSSILDSDTAGNPGVRQVSYAFTPGTYYLRVRAGSGSSTYTLDAN